MPNPLVSVVVPTFGRGRYLRAALDSAVRQTMADLEVIVTDDASPDDYATALVAEVGDPRIRVRRNAVNLGQAGNNAAAFAECRGTFVANLHDDDEWGPTFLERVTAPLLAHPDVAMAFCDHWIIDGDGHVQVDATEFNTALWGRTTLAPGRHQPFLEMSVVRQTVPLAMATVWRRSAVPWEQMPAEVNAAYDLFLCYLAARDGAAAWYVPERLTRYRVHTASATAGSRGTGFAASNVTAYRLMRADRRTAPIGRDLRRTLGEWEATLGLSLLAAGRPADARPPLAAAVRHRPTARAVAGLALTALPSAAAARAVARLRS